MQVHVIDEEMVSKNEKYGVEEDCGCELGDGEKDDGDKGEEEDDAINIEEIDIAKDHVIYMEAIRVEEVLLDKTMQS